MVDGCEDVSRSRLVKGGVGDRGITRCATTDGQDSGRAGGSDVVRSVAHHPCVAHSQPFKGQPDRPRVGLEGRILHGHHRRKELFDSVLQEKPVGVLWWEDLGGAEGMDKGGIEPATPRAAPQINRTAV